MKDTFKDIPWASSFLLQELVCERCAYELPWLHGICSRCGSVFSLEGESEGEISGGNDNCNFCFPTSFSFNRCCALGSYQGKIRSVLHRFKYTRQKFLAEPLGKLLSLKLLHMKWVQSLELVIPVPLTEEHMANRGFNQSYLLAAVISRELSLPLQDILFREGEAGSQTFLSRWERMSNVKDVFRCTKQFPSGRRVLLVDDILTSGATAHEASICLKKEGADQVSVAVVAR